MQILINFREVWQLWRLSGKTALHYCADNLAPICPSLLLAAQVLANTKTKRHIRKNTICHCSDELYNDTKTASRASLKQKTLRGTLAFTLPSYQATGSRVYLRVKRRYIGFRMVPFLTILLDCVYCTSRNCCEDLVEILCKVAPTAMRAWQNPVDCSSQLTLVVIACSCAFLFFLTYHHHGRFRGHHFLMKLIPLTTNNLFRTYSLSFF